MFITQEYIKEALYYDPITGEFTWREDRPKSHFKKEKGYNIWHGNYAGKIAGGVHTTEKTGKQYRLIGMAGKSYLAHRLAFLYMTGEMPDQVDHKNGDGLDNRWENLEKSDALKNNCNKGAYRKSRPLPRGVYRNPCKKPPGFFYLSVGTFNKKIETLYRGQDMFEAICARKSWEDYHFNCGNFTARHLGREE